MSGSRFFVVLAICGIVALPACRQSGSPRIELGALLPLTGSGANYGAYARNGIAIAVEEINRAGGVAGKEVRVLFEDSQSNATVGVSGFKKLLDVNRAPATLVEFSPVVMACAPIANARKSVLLNCGAQTPKVREAGPFVFSAIPDANEEATQMADFASRTLHLKNIATFCINTETGVATTDVFVKAFMRLGGNIRGQERHEQGSSDFRPQLSTLRSLSPQGVYMVSLTRESALILKQAAELGFKTQWLSYTSFQGEDILKVAREGGEGVVYTYPKFDPQASEQAKAFEASYYRKFSQHPEVYAATFYDGVYALKNAIEKSGASGEAIREGLRVGGYHGIAGPIDFRGSNWVSKPLDFRVVRGGQFAVYKR